ncbi:MAG: hypothetical protein PHX82_16825 [Paracoccaceae bacterium]|nr:hypothetical protein [Paracoccaceae bacterium]
MATKNAVSFEVQGKTCTLAYTMNAQVAFEEKTGVEFSAISEFFDQAQKGKISASRLREIFWAGLLDGAPDTTLREAGDLIDALGLEATFEKIGQAVVRAYPSAAPAGNDVAAAGVDLPAA